MDADVITLVHGGLGNQFFQYAATRRTLELTGGTTARMVFVGDQWPPDAPQLGDFVNQRIDAQRRADRMQWSGFSRRGGIVERAVRELGVRHEARSKRTIIRQSAPFDPPVPLQHGEHVLLDGFFQSLDWIGDTWHAVAEEILAGAPAGFEELAAQDITVLKLRRGDYVGYGWDLRPNYYLRAIDALGLAGRPLVVTCEEPSFIPWLTALVRPLGCEVVAPPTLTGEATLDDFWTLAAARTHILANSSFSWWGAAVAAARHGDIDVAYPRPWLTNLWTHQIWPDLGLPGWVPIESDLPPFRT